MYGQGHRYCGNCNHVIHRNASGCRSCGAGLDSLLMYDAAFDQGTFNGNIGFDPMDNQIDVDPGGFDLPIWE